MLSIIMTLMLFILIGMFYVMIKIKHLFIEFGLLRNDLINSTIGIQSRIKEMSYLLNLNKKQLSYLDNFDKSGQNKEK
jgi:hypothetical protein